ncbi:hypothetical protein ACFSUI_08725 [Ralstonia solanacearum]
MQWIFCENLLTPEVFARYNPAFRGLAAQCRKPGVRAQDAGRSGKAGAHQGFSRGSKAFSGSDLWIFVHSIFSRSFAVVSRLAAASA